MSKKGRGQDTIPFKSKTPPKAKAAEGVVPTEKQKEEIRAASRAVTNAKLQLADQVLAVFQSVALVEQTNDAFWKTVKDVAQQHGIDTEDPAKGKWSLNPETLVFNKVG